MGGTMRWAGGILVVLGFAGLLLGGIPYKKTENIAQFGDLKMQVTEKKQLSVPPAISGVAILAGAAMLFARRRPGGPA